MPNKYSQYFAIEKQMKALGFEPDRTELIEMWGESTGTSLRELTYVEYREFCTWLNQRFIPDNKKSWQDTPENRMRRKVIGIFKEMEYTLPNGKADMKAINSWCSTHGKFKKQLNSHSKQELTTLIFQAEKAKASFIKSVTK